MHPNDEDDAEHVPALSIRQPWAELVLAGRKPIEVRTWSDSYRGPLWVHTGRVPNAGAVSYFGLNGLFTGGFVGRVTLLDIVPFTDERWEQWRESHCVPGPPPALAYAWVLGDPRRFAEPVPAMGKLRLFRVDDATEALLKGRPFDPTTPTES